jgi:glycogen synthase
MLETELKPDSKADIEPKADMVFEVSWEVCNKVGGIYTVVKSKAELMVAKYKKYCLIGPYLETARFETQQHAPPHELKQVFDELEKEGITCYYGTWITKGEPNVILIDFKKIIGGKNDFKQWYWENYKIDSLYANWDFEEPLIWSWAVGKLLCKIADRNKGAKIVGHFHEWLAGLALLYVKKNCSNIKTVFTTHATMLGRSLAGSGKDLYAMLEHLNPDEEAYNSRIQEKYLTEKACAWNADMFTTVSETTGYEAEKIFGKKPDWILMNGLDIDKFPTFEESSIKHREFRESIRKFVSYFFFPYYSFELDQTLLYFIVGRYEYHNKGIDIFIKALGRINEQMKKEDSPKTIIAFFWIPTAVSGIKIKLLEKEDEYKQIIDFVEKNIEPMKERIISRIFMKKVMNSSDLVDKEFMQEIKKLMAKFNDDKNTPPLVTHYLFNEDDDTIIRGFREAGLLNRAEDKVKVVMHPVYLDGTDSCLDLKYYDAMQGCHLGVFPSYYEPWGYTPLESAALGVPSVTTDLSGFGKFMASKIGDKKGGIYVLKRFNRPEDDVIKQLADVMYNFSKMKQNERVEQKLLAKELAKNADWKILVNEYITAHNMALLK